MSLFENSTNDDSRGSFRRAYYRYFNGYTEMVKEDGRGKGKIVRVYTEDYWKQDLASGQRVLLKLAYIILFLLALAVFSAAASQRVVVNYMWYVVTTEACAVFFLARLALTLINYVAAPQKMTIGKYQETSPQIKKRSKAAGVFMLSNAVSCGYYGIRYGCLTEAWLIRCIIAFVVAGTVIFSVSFIEKQVNYVVENNPNKGKVHGAEIY